MDETTDGLDLLRSDHGAVFTLFAQIEAIPASLPGDTVDMQRRRALFEQVSAALSRHAMAEEALLYPLARDVLHDGEAVADRALSEHREVKETLARLDGMSVDNVGFDGELRGLMATIRAHVDDEENDLFPRLASALDADALAELGRDLERAERMAPTRARPDAPFDGLAGAGVAVVHREPSDN